MKIRWTASVTLSKEMLSAWGHNSVSGFGNTPEEARTDLDRELARLREMHEKVVEELGKVEAE